ncbi:MAG TPA: TrkA family potassium uptake protein [Acidimicrobiales bacterium]|nr:TrkA family potassium uptake protein [Acidimicrobiales bacterium]
MRVVIVGCGRSGSALAARLDAEGDSVCVVDRDEASRARLPAGFGGTFLRGDGMRRAVLESAGLEGADAFVALSSSDSLNIVASRVARDVFHVPHVVGRLHDVERLPICSDLGLPMVTSVRMIVDRVHRMVRHPRFEPERTFGNGESVLVRSPVPDYLAGRHVAEFNVPGEIQVVEVTRGGHSSIPDTGALLQAGDVLSFVVASTSLGRLRSFLGGRLS